MEEKQLRRASVDYRDLANVTIHKNYDAFLREMGDRRIFALTTKGSVTHTEPSYQADDVLLFGSETSGLPDNIRNSFGAQNRIRIPMLPNARSLNLSNSIAIVSYEAWRQVGFAMPNITD
jgi:tRNA (cytidine/uridine-2'-O-)-methyltransferase